MAPLSVIGMDTDMNLLAAVAAVATEAGDRLLAVYSPDARPAGRDELLKAATRNEEVSSAGMRDALTALRPGARWLEEENETGPLPGGEWWVVDNAEGSVNHVHGLPEWAVTATLLRDGRPVLAVVRQPVADLTYTAVAGGGAWVNGQRLTTSAKRDLDAAVVGTGQAEAGQDETHARIGRSIAAMLGEALLVRASVPSTFPMLRVAAGQEDAFWLYSPVLPGVAAGALFVTEAGGIVSRLDGSAWQPGAADILVCAPALHQDVVRVLATA